jgi:very-short-patch-repair endonuclease
MNWWGAQTPEDQDALRRPVHVSARTLGAAVEQTLIDGFTRDALCVVLADELDLPWPHDDDPRDRSKYAYKRDVIRGYTTNWTLPNYVALGRRIIADYNIVDQGIQTLLDAYESTGGVEGNTKNLIFAANGPKPDIVLRDALSNDIEIVANGEYCLVYDQPIPAEGLTMAHLAAWWRQREHLGEGTAEKDAALALYARLRASVEDNPAELVVFDAYTSRYRNSLDIPALIPQVYLHYDPHDQRLRHTSATGAPLARQRMDFLLLFSDKRRVVIEVDGKQHYADRDKASPDLYGRMVAEDRRLKLSGYEVFRFGGAELFNAGSQQMVQTFFDELANRMNH